MYIIISFKVLMEGITYIYICNVYFIGVINKLRVAQGGDWRMHLMLLVAWFASLSAQSMSRLSLAVGCAIATREVYTDLIVRARNLSHWFGDMILEPN